MQGQKGRQRPHEYLTKGRGAVARSGTGDPDSARAGRVALIAWPHLGCPQGVGAEPASAPACPSGARSGLDPVFRSG
jgi:hypothetical protein